MVTLRSQRDTGKPMPPETLDLAGFEFYKFMCYGISWEELLLPDKFARVLRGREPREMKLRVAGSEGRRAWDVELIVDEYGDMCLGDGWREFAGANGLEPGQLLVFRFDGAALFTVTVFDDSDCRRRCQHEEDDGAEGKSGSGSENGGSSVDGEWDGTEEEDATEAAPSQFTVVLRKCHFGQRKNQYLAHGYAERSKVVLQMRGESWTVSLKHTKWSGGRIQVWFRYGWHRFCVDNGLGLGDACFFHALPEGRARRGAGEDHVLRVEVRKQDGTVVR